MNGSSGSSSSRSRAPRAASADRGARPAVAAPKTRDRILEAALRLFNDEGLPAVSTHRIAAELGISPGNLHYHFKTKRLIVVWLFRRFEDRLEPCLAAASKYFARGPGWMPPRMERQTVGIFLVPRPIRSQVTSRVLCRRVCWTRVLASPRSMGCLPVRAPLVPAGRPTSP